MTKIYLVFEESWSECTGTEVSLPYGIRGLFKSREKADIFVEDAKEKGDFTVGAEIIEVESDF